MTTTNVLEEIAGRAAAVVAAFDVQGWHRTGTEVDNDSATWLAGLAEPSAHRTEAQPFELRRVDPLECSVAVGDTVIPAVPAFDGTFLNAPLSAAIGPIGSAAPIGLAVATPGGPSPEIDDARRAGSHEAIVVVTKGVEPGLAPRNATHFPDSFGPPVLFVSSEYEDVLNNVEGSVTVTARAMHTPCTALNVVAEVEGRDPGLPPIAVMTPRSGWWNCAAERGGGIACSLESLHQVSKSRPLRTVRFIASSGHELNHLGLDAYLDRYAQDAERTAVWIHLGASIGAAEAQLANANSDDDAERVITAAMEAAGCPPARKMPRGWIPGGESRNIHERGWRYVSLLGGSPYFHLESDRWPASVDIDAVARFAVATSSAVLSFANQPDAG